ncbi:hypothetical protein [Acetobacter thailandicus]|uniref:hypothetical protein n=1 Tax=Acetobacter thailandicus TaxID=1502842 RepID=UPI0038D215F8
MKPAKTVVCIAASVEAQRSQFFTSLLHRVAHANDLSTIHRQGSSTTPRFV